MNASYERTELSVSKHKLKMRMNKILRLEHETEVAKQEARDLETLIENLQKESK